MAGARQPVDPRLAEEYLGLALAAELRLTEMPGLGTPSSRSIEPVDQATWVEENQQSFGYMIEPLADRFGSQPGSTPMTEIFSSLAPALLGMQAGTMVGTLGHTVMGQFDAGMPPLEHDRRYAVVPNIEGFAAYGGLDPQQVRMWAVLHEIAFHTIMDVPWLRGHIVSVVGDLLSSIEVDPERLAGQIGSISSPEQLEEMLGESTDLSSLMGIEVDRSRSAPVEALVAFIEGYGDFAVAGASRGLLPDHDRIAAAAAARRSGDEATRSLEIAGVTLSRSGAADAAQLCTEVAERWGTDALARVWEAPEHLPTIEELADPVGWAARVLLPLGDLGLDT
jgi:putative hydrolase